MRYCFRSEVSLSRDSPALTMLEARTLKIKSAIFEAAPYPSSFMLLRLNIAGQIKDFTEAADLNGCAYSDPSVIKPTNV
jgi:hypothetical protein